MAKSWIYVFVLVSFVVLRTAASDCPLGWDGFGNSCYMFVVRSLTVQGLNWENSRAVCLGYGGDLVSVANRTEMDFIYNISSKVINEHYWIGLNYQRNESTFLWSDKTSYNSTVYSNWRNGEPNSQGKAKICVELYHSHWDDDSCKKEYGYICERLKGVAMPTVQTAPPHVTPTPIGCPPDWTGFSSSCYKFVDLQKKWIDAKKDCRARGGYLMKIDNASEQYFITLQLRPSSNNMWIGLSDSAHEGTFIWEGDDSLVNFTHWRTGAPNNFGGVEDCVEVYSGAMAGFWNDDYCDSEKHFICEKPDGQNLCPVNWRTFGDFCYQFNVHGAQDTSWESAEKACTAFKGAGLLSILNAKEQAYILRELKDMKITQTWLGLNRKEGTFEWSDRSVVKYTNWASSGPSKGPSPVKRDCVVMDVNSRKGLWSATSCTWKTGYICKRDIGFDQCDSPLGMEDGNIGDNEITASNSLNMSTRASHARLRVQAGVTTLGAWCAAHNKQGEFLQIDLGVVRQLTHIALQGRPSSSDFVKTFYLKYGNNRKDFNTYGENATVKYKILQGNSDAKTVHNMILPEPLDARFVRIYPLTWSNTICLRTELYGCASQASSKKCGIGWEEGPDNSTCYQINANHRKLWADARATCVRRGGDLLSILRQEENRWINRRLNALSGWAYSFWLGLNDRDYESRYYWSDGSPLTFTFWDGGYPTDRKGEKSCVEVTTHRGLWRDVSCGEYRPFVCKRKLLTENGAKISITGNWISATDYYWPFDRVVDGKALGTVLAKVVGNVSIPDRMNNGRKVFHFEAYNAYLDAGRFTGQCITDPDKCFYGITVSFVVLFRDAAKSWMRNSFIIDTIGDNMLQNNRGFAVFVVRNHLHVSVFTEKRSWSVKETLSTERWQHVMFTWHQEQGLLLYIDGKIRSSSTYGATLSPPHSTDNSLFVVGSRSNQPTAGGFYMRSLAVWKRQLSSEEVDEIYLAEFGSCQLDWKEFGQFCYLFNRLRTRWDSARVYCVNRQADLVSIHTPVEQAFIALEGASIGFDTDAWIGLNDHGGTASGLEWSDGSDEEYSFWGSGEPDNLSGIRGGTDCTQMFHTLDSSWRAVNCNWAAAYICKKRKEYIPTDSNSSKIVLQNFKVCGPNSDGLFFQGMRCPFSMMMPFFNDDAVLKIISASWGHNNADICDNQNITNCQLNVTSTIKSRCDGLSHCSIRVSNADYLPDPCVGIRKSLKINYVCIQEVRNPGCPAGWQRAPDGSRCFGLLFDRKTWKQARDACKAYGAELASFHNRTENTVLTSLLVNSWDIEDVEGIWIGLTNDGHKGMYRWSDGSPLGYSSWRNGEPDDVQFTAGSCVRATIQRGKTHWLFWQDSVCSDVLPYACAMFAKNYTKTPSPLPTTAVSSGVCPAFWKSNGSSCYRMMLSKKTWTGARDYCREHGFGYDLASIHSSQENAFVAHLFNGSLFAAWLGLSNRGVFAGYVWSDSTPVQFTQWNPQQPDSHHGQQPCVEMYSTGDWGDTGCYSVKPFICKMPKPNSLPTPAPTTIPPVITTQSPDICPPGWKLWNTMCYLYTKYATWLNWHDARRACQRVRGGDLVSIHSVEENTFIKTYLRDYDWTWIGLNDLGTEASYRWSDSSPLFYTNYDLHQPNDEHGQEDCTAFRRGGYWSDKHCSDKISYICKTHNNTIIPSSTNNPPTPGPVLGRCKEAWVNYGKSCYLIASNSSVSWLDARDMCRKALNSTNNNTINSDLVTINDQYEQAFLTTILLGSKLNFWIGFNSLHGPFHWTDNDTPEYTYWNVYQPNSNWKRHCVEMTSQFFPGRWTNVRCDVLNGFICETGALPISTTGPTTAAPRNRKCPDRYELLGDDCYFVSYVRLTWHEAREACRRESGGDLISVHDPFEQAFIVRNLKNVQGGMWLGFFRESNSSDFIWTDNSLKIFTNWAPNQPDAPRTNRTCVVANNSLPIAGLWNDADCSGRNGFVCKIRTGEPYISPQLLGSCPDGWVKFDKSCYMFAITESSSWTGSRLSCQRRGGNLVSITSQHEQDFLLFYFLKKLFKASIWIGLNDRALERGYEWSDKSAVTFLNWGPGQPTNSGSKNCVLMSTSDGLWKDWDCRKVYDYYSFVCKRHLDCSEALGMASGSITDAQITATSSLHSAYDPAFARLNSLSSWCAKSSQLGQSIQIDLLTKSRLTEIAMQGFKLNGLSSYVMTFKVQTSDDAVRWRTFQQKGGRDWVFVANHDASNVGTLTLRPAVDTRFVRILPLSWVNVICLRMELYGCKFACETPLGMQSGEIKDDFLSASSATDKSHSANQVRPSGLGWCPKKTDTQPWLQIDFPATEWKISKLTTWGGGQGSRYATVYRLAYKDKTTNWTDYREGGRIRTFRGNLDTVNPETHALAEPIIAQFLRLSLLSWAADGACLRLELFGCQTGCDSALGLRQGVIKDSSLSASSSLDRAHATSGGRLDGKTGWCASDSDQNPYFLVDMGRLMRIQKVALQGAKDGKGYVKTYTVSLKEDLDSPWKAFEQDGKPKVFVANTNTGSTTVQHTFSDVLRARFIKILPSDWNIRACFRLELYGCPPDSQSTATPPTALPSGGPAPSKDVVYTGSVRLAKEKWYDDYRDSKSDAFKTLAEKLRSAITRLYSGADEPSLAFRQVVVTGFRKGSVIALFDLTFYRDMAMDPGVDVKSNLRIAVKSGKVGELEVDPHSLSISEEGLNPTTFSKETSASRTGVSSSGLPDGAEAGIAIAALLLLGVCGSLLIWWYRNKRKEKKFSYKECDHRVLFSSKTEEAELL